MSDIQYTSGDATAASPVIRAEADGTISMPANPAPGQTVTVVTGGNAITISGNGNNVNGGADGTGAAAALITCVYSGGNWVCTGLGDDASNVDIA